MRHPEDIGGIVAADLRNSGKFNPLDCARLPQQPGSAQETTSCMVALGIDAVVVGQVTPNPGWSETSLINLLTLAAHRVLYLPQNSYKVNKQWLELLRRSYRQ